MRQKRTKLQAVIREAREDFVVLLLAEKLQFLALRRPGRRRLSGHLLQAFAGPLRLCRAALVRLSGILARSEFLDRIAPRRLHHPGRAHSRNEIVAVSREPGGHLQANLVLHGRLDCSVEERNRLVVRNRGRVAAAEFAGAHERRQPLLARINVGLVLGGLVRRWPSEACAWSCVLRAASFEVGRARRFRCGAAGVAPSTT